MSLESVKTHFTQWNGENDVTEFETSSATVLNRQLRRSA